MSADNVLIILQHEEKVRVYDVNFSWISGFEEWSFPMDQEKSQFFTNLIVKSPHEYEVHKCETENQAIGFCKRYIRENLVEYDYCSIIPEQVAGEIQKAKIKKKKAKLKNKNNHIKHF